MTFESNFKILDVFLAEMLYLEVLGGDIGSLGVYQCCA